MKKETMIDRLKKAGLDSEVISNIESILNSDPIKGHFTDLSIEERAIIDKAKDLLKEIKNLNYIVGIYIKKRK